MRAQAMKFYKKNPRKITQQKLRELRKRLVEFGDLGGVVHDLNSDQVISANQRVAALDLQHVSPTIIKEYPHPTSTGTVAVGYFESGGEMFSYRAVRWTPEQCAKANLVANTHSGTWDADLLRDMADILPTVGMDRDWLNEIRETSDSLEALFNGLATDDGEASETEDLDDDFEDRFAPPSPDKKRVAPPVSETIAAMQGEIEDDGKKHIVYIVLSGKDWVNFQTLKRYWDVASDKGLITRMMTECLNYISASSS